MDQEKVEKKAKKKVSKKAPKAQMIVIAKYPFATINQPVDSVEAAADQCRAWKEQYHSYNHRFSLVEVGEGDDKIQDKSLTSELMALLNPVQDQGKKKS